MKHDWKEIDETELCVFFVAITGPSLFVSEPVLLRGRETFGNFWSCNKSSWYPVEKHLSMSKERNGDKKMHRVPFHQGESDS